MDKTKPHGLFPKGEAKRIIFFQTCPLLDSNPLPSPPRLIPQKECESTETVLSLMLSARVHWLFGVEVMAFTITNTAVA
jgi:hypothetical protein